MLAENNRACAGISPLLIWTNPRPQVCLQDLVKCTRTSISVQCTS